MKLFVLCLVLAIASASAQEAKDTSENSINGRITNGYPAYEGKVPYIVGLALTSNGARIWCSGSIIGHTWVITAAHCTNSADGVTIYYGASFRLEGQYTHWVGRGDFVQHPDYNSDNLNNDIALIRTPHVDFWSLVNKVDLPSFADRYNSYDGSWAVASGWGNWYDDSGLSNYLNCVDVQIISNSACSDTFGNLITDKTICIATTDGKSTCGGDSGGPLVLHDGNLLVGITSFGAGGGCQSGKPAAFTRVSGYLDWIRDTTGISY